MAETSSIEWTDSTWNVITGCTLVSEGCRHCYAATLAAGRLQNHPSRKGLARVNAAGEAKFTGEVRFNEEWLDQPLRWRRPRMIFVCAHGDLFHESVPDEWIDRVFAVMALAPQHVFQVLTKRPERAREMLRAVRRPGLPERVLKHINALAADRDQAMAAICRPVTQLPNVWLGTSVEDQAAADERIPHLLATPAAVRFLSAEPLLGPVSLRWLAAFPESAPHTAMHPSGRTHHLDGLRRLDWVIVGGESGRGARPMHPDWARSLRDQCAAAGVPFFFKQWGSWKNGSDFAPDAKIVTNDGRVIENQIDAIEAVARLEPGRTLDPALMRLVGKAAAGRLLDGVEHNGMPEVRHG